MLARFRIWLVVFFAAALPAAVSACSVCATGKEAARPLYYASTAFLSLAPLAMVGGVVYYLAKKRT